MEKMDIPEENSLDSLEGISGIEIEKSKEKLLELQEKIFGPKPEYLSSGLDAWLSASDTQATEGIAGLMKHQRFEIFNAGMASYYHQEPKDIGAVSARLRELGYFVGELPSKRQYGEAGGGITPEFEELFANASDTDLKKAGSSFYGGRTLHENLETIARLGIDLTVIDPSTFSAWRRKDYDVHRRELDTREFELFLTSLDAQTTYRDFYEKHKKEYIDDTMTEEDEIELKRLKQLVESTKISWWSYYASVVRAARDASV